MRNWAGWALLPLALALAGCTNWPDAGRGGMAELHAPPALALPADHETLGEAVACTLARLDSLQQRAEELGVMTGRFALVRGRATRLTREYAAGLYADVARNLPALRDVISALGRDLPPGTTLPPECS